MADIHISADFGPGKITLRRGQAIILKVTDFKLGDATLIPVGDKQMEVEIRLS